MMIHLEENIYFNLFWVLPILFIGFLLVSYWKKKKRRIFADKSLLKILSPNISNFKYWLKAVMFILSYCFIVIALVNPQIGGKKENIKREGVDLVFLLDISKSMLAEDVVPNRLEKAKQLILKTIDNLLGDRVGIIVYAGQPYPLLPITTDYAASKLFLSNVDTDLLSSHGTAIADALKMTEDFFDNENQKSRVVILLSDGEDHEDDALEEATRLGKSGIKVYTIGLGETKGSPIPIKKGGNLIDYKEDLKGNIITTALNESVLKDIAKLSNAKYLKGIDTKTVIEFIKEMLNETEKAEIEMTIIRNYNSQFQWFLALALVLLIIDFFLLERKTSWLQKWNLFNENQV